MKIYSKLPVIAVCLGFFMVVMDVTIVNVALPQLGQNLHSNVSQLQWIVDGYTLTFACFLLCAGYFADLYGAKKIFIMGLIGFIITSLGCGIAANVMILIIARLLQGLTAALLIPTSLSLINNSYTEEKDRARAIGIWASSGAVAAASGPVLGGILINYFSWRAVFLVNIPLGIIGVYLSCKYTIDTLKRQDKIRFDIPGQLLIIISIAALAFSLIEAPNLGWTSIWIILSFILFIISLLLFVLIESKISQPMVDISLFKSANFSLSAILGVLQNFAFYGFIFIMPLYLHSIKHFTTLQIGLALFPLTVLMFVGNRLSGKMCGIQGPKLPTWLGFTLNMLAFIILFIMVYYHVAYSIMIFPMLLIGFAISLIMPALTVIIIRATPKGKVGFASAMFNMSRQIGSLLGVAIFGTIVGMVSNLNTGMNIVLLIVIITCFVGMILTSLLSGKDLQ